MEVAFENEIDDLWRHPTSVGATGVDHVGGDAEFGQFDRSRDDDAVEGGLARSVGKIERCVVAGDGGDAAGSGTSGRELLGEGLDQLPYTNYECSQLGKVINAFKAGKKEAQEKIISGRAKLRDHALTVF